jgi:hypothetical protein
MASAAAAGSYHIPPSLRIAVVQFAPKIGQVEENVAKAKDLCAKCVRLSTF